MKNRKVWNLLCAAAVAVSMSAGPGVIVKAEAEETAAEENKEESKEENIEEASDEEAGEEVSAEPDREAEAEQLLQDLAGTYEELWPVVLSEEYAQDWLDECTAIVGEDAAQEAVDMLQGSVTGTIYGQEAVDAYADSDSSAFYCDFLDDVKLITFEGDTISGVDADENELFSHSYTYAGYDETTGFYEYAAEDSDAGEFAYFALRGDTPETTAHIEFRYGSDLDELVKFVSGDYAYWMASGILAGDNQEMAKESIHIFCTENLQGE